MGPIQIPEGRQIALELSENLPLTDNLLRSVCFEGLYQVPCFIANTIVIRAGDPPYQKL